MACSDTQNCIISAISGDRATRSGPEMFLGRLLVFWISATAAGRSSHASSAARRAVFFSAVT